MAGFRTVFFPLSTFRNAVSLSRLSAIPSERMSVICQSKCRSRCRSESSTLRLWKTGKEDSDDVHEQRTDEAFGINFTGAFAEPESTALTLEFTADQLRAMLAEAERKEAGIL